MKTSWIIGEQAVSKLIILAKVLYNSRVRELGNNHYNQYESWMSDPRFSEHYMQVNTCDNHSLFHFNAQFLKSFNDACSSQSYLNILNKNHSDILDTTIQNDVQRQLLFEWAWSLMKSSTPWLKALADDIIVDIFPICSADFSPATSKAFTDKSFIGAIFTSISKCEMPLIDMTISFAHELGHNALMIYQSGTPIILSGHDAWIYSGVRKTERPIMMVYHAAVALGYMLECTEGLLCNVDLSQDEYAYIKEKQFEFKLELQKSLKGLFKFSYTNIGTMILKDLDQKAHAS